jgi:hypothetical protein
MGAEKDKNGDDTIEWEVSIVDEAVGWLVSMAMDGDEVR